MPNPSTTISPELWGGVYEALISANISLPAVVERRRKFLSQAGLQGEWPERLLYVPTMTSVKREHSGQYQVTKSLHTDRIDNFIQPRFTVLSYKWGLWVVKDGSRLEVNGIDWETPAIDRAHWTVDQFQQLIRRMAQDTDFVWIDVACINQFLSDSTLREIQKEPQKFRKATQAFV